eukprot:CAMPEP_0181424442 /NCGR_PEP_ID=MMETSP1110-20121109/14647_1 /TAXON_ID=174948 /ORGANISM="Symbiodinium sp., Strain CCMP421" /LENGTH=521 /DNA_ID=CAMNT_0023547601 /DNA_START=97 /DNA_END=1662 /DNA_ORIENTATION=+
MDASEANVTPAPLQMLLEQVCATSPRKIAIRMEGVEVSYFKLHQWVRRLASALVGSGIETTDRVAWLLPNCLEAVALTCACYCIGAVSVPINVRYSPKEVSYMVDKVKAKIIFLQVDTLPVISDLSLDTLEVVTVGPKVHRHTSWSDFEQREGETSLRPLPPSHPALILFTSGSTGRPKGVLHSLGGCWAAISTSAGAFGLGSEDVVLVGKPITHAGGLQTQLLPALMVGGEVVLAMIPPPARAVELIKRFQVTTYAMLVSSLLDFVQHLERSQESLTSLQRVVGSGDCVPLELQDRFLLLFGRPVIEGCGITEVGCYFSMQPIGKEKPGSIGLPTAGTEVRLVDDDGNDVPSGLPGEVLLRTPSATLGYWDDPHTTTELFQDGWLRTGDIARQDDDGYLWFVGRRKLIIIRRGSNIAPAAVERVLSMHPEVHSSVVVGVPDEKDGQVPAAWIVANSQDPPTPAMLEKHMSKHLAAYQRPVYYWFLKELPLNSVGKFDRASLQNEARAATKVRWKPSHAGA